MKNPKPLSEVGNFFDCPALTQTSCSNYSCYFEGDASPVGPRNMNSCVTCPDVYPWTGNPLGLPWLFFMVNMYIQNLIVLESNLLGKLQGCIS